MKYINVSCTIFLLLSCCFIKYTDSNTVQLNHNRINYETTTAVPLFNTTKFTVRVSEVTSTTQTSTVTTDLIKNQTTPGTTPSGVFYTTTTGEIFTTNFAKNSTTNVEKFSTTTAIPLGASSSLVQRQFDALSFMGGCLFTVCIITTGVFIWKMYEAKIERSYLTI